MKKFFLLALISFISSCGHNDFWNDVLPIMIGKACIQGDYTSYCTMLYQETLKPSMEKANSIIMMVSDTKVNEFLAVNGLKLENLTAAQKSRFVASHTANGSLTPGSTVKLISGRTITVGGTLEAPTLDGVLLVPYTSEDPYDTVLLREFYKLQGILPVTLP